MWTRVYVHKSAIYSYYIKSKINLDIGPAETASL